MCISINLGVYIEFSVVGDAVVKCTTMMGGAVDTCTLNTVCLPTPGHSGPMTTYHHQSFSVV